MKLLHVGLCAAVFGMFGGCGPALTPRPKVVPVSGKVLLDGKPVEGVTVQFLNKNSPRTAVGVTDANGQFRLTTYDTNDGAIVGDHVVTIFKPAAGAAGGPELVNPSANPEEWKKQYEQKMRKPQAAAAIGTAVPAKYADPKTSGLLRQVIEGDENVFTIELTSQ